MMEQLLFRGGVKLTVNLVKILSHLHQKFSNYLRKHVQVLCSGDITKTQEQQNVAQLVYCLLLSQRGSKIRPSCRYQKIYIYIYSSGHLSVSENYCPYIFLVTLIFDSAFRFLFEL